MFFLDKIITLLLNSTLQWCLNPTAAEEKYLKFTIFADVEK